MKITTSQTDHAVIVKIEGDLLIGGLAQAKPTMVAALSAGEEIRLDLGATGECDTAGIQFLLMARASALAQGKRFATIAQSASFRTAILRIGVPVACFDSQEKIV
jgi:anti-anti-sigma regulatory factor